MRPSSDVEQPGQETVVGLKSLGSSNDLFFLDVERCGLDCKWSYFSSNINRDYIRLLGFSIYKKNKINLY